MTCMENHELSKHDYLHKAEAYCARAEHCASDVKRKLIQWGAEDFLFDEIVESLYANDYLNDERFCRAYVHDKIEYQHWGKIKIKAGLVSLQLPNKAINNALNSIDLTHYLSILRNTAEKYHATSKEQLYRFLLQRGFSFDEIDRTLHI